MQTAMLITVLELQYTLKKLLTRRDRLLASIETATPPEKLRAQAPFYPQAASDW